VVWVKRRVKLYAGSRVSGLILSNISDGNTCTVYRSLVSY
jgi:hypothetical protein